MSGSKSKSSGDVAGTILLFKVLYGKIKSLHFLHLFLCIICVKSNITLLQYTAIYLTVLVDFLS